VDGSTYRPAARVRPASEGLDDRVTQFPNYLAACCSKQPLTPRNMLTSQTRQTEDQGRSFARDRRNASLGCHKVRSTKHGLSSHSSRRHARVADRRHIACAYFENDVLDSDSESPRRTYPRSDSCTVRQGCCRDQPCDQIPSG
jgi:hypothetical protein